MLPRRERRFVRSRTRRALRSLAFSQLSLALNLLLVGVAVPVGVNTVMTRKYQEQQQSRTALDVAQLLSDHDHAVLESLNARRSSKSLPALARLPSSLNAAELDAVVAADRASAAGGTAALVHGIHADAPTEWERNLFLRCDRLRESALADIDHAGKTHRSSGAEHSPEEVLAEAKRQGLDI
jgi:hypothetical protein